jgi:membrane-associated phospholipid phosphatase
VGRRLATTIGPLRDEWTWECGIVGALLAAFLTLLLAVDHSAPTSLDRRLAGQIQAIPWGALDFVPRLGSDLGGGVVGLVVAPLLAAATFAALRRWRLLVPLLAIFALHFVMISPKLFVTAYRPSPAFGVEGPGGLHSFPSGHVQWTVSLYGFLAYLAWRVAPERLRVLILPTYAAVVVATMLGRIEQGRHWPLDTVGGVLAGLIALRLVILLHARVGRPTQAGSAA